MELPLKLKALYRHWPAHVAPARPFDTDLPLMAEIRWFISERLSIWKQKDQGLEAPYTADPVLARFRFCNIFREFDRQTIEFHELLNPIRDDFPLWLLNMFYCRMVARPETIRSVGLLSFEPAHNEKVYQRLMASPRPRFGTPYVFPVSAIQRSATPTRELFIAHYLPHAIPPIAEEVARWRKESVFSGVEKVLPLFKFNLVFLWTEVLIDVAYQFPERLDLFARFPVGPGALPTLKRIDATTDPTLLVQNLATMSGDTDITFEGQPLRLSAENWEGIACEFRKYTNLSSGKGRRRIFSAHT